MRVLKIPGVMLATASIIATSMSIGFLQATLEPHLRVFDLSPVVLGLMFVINGGTYAVTAPVWGWFCDKRIKPKVSLITRAIIFTPNFGYGISRDSRIIECKVKYRIVYDISKKAAQLLAMTLFVQSRTIRVI